jgi:hypothetical protein
MGERRSYTKMVGRAVVFSVMAPALVVGYALYNLGVVIRRAVDADELSWGKSFFLAVCLVVLFLMCLECRP